MAHTLTIVESIWYMFQNVWKTNIAEYVQEYNQGSFNPS